MLTFKTFLAETQREAEQWPGVAVSHEFGGKHFKLILSYCGQERTAFCPVSASDRRAILNHIADVRRQLTDMGATRLERPKRSGPKPKRNRPERAMTVERAPVIPDPFEALRGMV